jgi:hypothetical protein
MRKVRGMKGARGRGRRWRRSRIMRRGSSLSPPPQ